MGGVSISLSKPARLSFYSWQYWTEHGLVSEWFWIWQKYLMLAAWLKRCQRALILYSASPAATDLCGLLLPNLEAIFGQYLKSPGHNHNDRVRLPPPPPLPPTPVCMVYARSLHMWLEVLELFFLGEPNSEHTWCILAHHLHLGLLATVDLSLLCRCSNFGSSRQPSCWAGDQSTSLPKSLM